MMNRLIMARALSLRHVEMIHAVVLTGSVVSAASRLAVTPSAISNLLRETEDRLEFPLFDRLGGRLQPTERAKLVFAEIERAFTGLAEINDLCARLRHQTKRRVVIAATPAFATAVLPSVMKAYTDSDPDVQFTIASRGSDYVQALVASHKADVGFGLNVNEIQGVRNDLVAAERLICLLPPGHRLACREFVTADDLCDDPMIWPSSAERIDSLILHAFGSTGRRPPIVAECTAALMACEMVQCGMGFAILDPLSTYLFRDSGVLLRRFEPEISLNVYAFWLDERPASFDRDRFLADVKSAVSERMVALDVC